MSNQSLRAALLTVGVGVLCGAGPVDARQPAPQQIQVGLTDANPAARDANLVVLVSEPDVRLLSRRVERALRDTVLRGALDPRVTGRTAAPVNAVTLEVGEDGAAVGKAKLSWRLDDFGSFVDLILKGPIAKSSGVPLTDRGLADGASATLGYTLTLWGASVSVPVGLSVVARTTTAGSSRLAPLESIVAVGLAQRQLATRDAALAAREVRDQRDGTLRLLGQPDLAEAFRGREPHRIAAALRAARLANLVRTVALSGNYTVGSHTFAFSETPDPIVTRRETKRDTGFGLNLAYMQLLRQDEIDAPLLLLSAGYTRRQAYTPRQTKQICTPLGVSGAQECRSLIIGTPTEGTTRSIEVDVRSWAYAQKLGVNPHLSYDHELRQWTSEVGLSYLVLTKEPAAGELPRLDAQALTVGIRVGSRPSSAGGPFAAIFFGTVLGMR